MSLMFPKKCRRAGCYRMTRKDHGLCPACFARQTRRMRLGQISAVEDRVNDTLRSGRKAGRIGR